MYVDILGAMERPFPFNLQQVTTVITAIMLPPIPLLPSFKLRKAFLANKTMYEEQKSSTVVSAATKSELQNNSSEI